VCAGQGHMNDQQQLCGVWVRVLGGADKCMLVPWQGVHNKTQHSMRSISCACVSAATPMMGSTNSSFLCTELGSWVC